MIIKRYLTREVVTAMSAVTLVLLVAFLCQQIVRYLNYAAIGKVPTSILLQLVSFEIPYLLALLLPLGLYFGILLAYGRLYADQEMAILQMSGFGNNRLLKLTSTIALLIALIVLILMMWVNPWISAKRQQVMNSDEATLHLIQTLIPGRLQPSPDGRHVMYVESMSRDRSRAENVFMAQAKDNPDNPDQASWMLVFASQGYQMKDKPTQETFFVTTDGYRYEGTVGQNNYKMVQFKKYAVRIPQNDMQVTHQEDEALSISQLLNDYNNPKRAAELQWRFSISLSAFLLALLAVTMSMIRPRQGRYMRLLPAGIIYIVYVNLLFVARHWVEQGKIPIIVGMWWVHVLVLISFVLLFSFRPKV